MNRKRIFIGQINAQPFNLNRSHLVYQFLNYNQHFLIDPNNGIIEYISHRQLYKKTIEQFQIIVRDLIYNQNTTINITIHIIQQNQMKFSSLIYHRFVSEILPPGSNIFQFNFSNTFNLYYTLENYNSKLFQIDTRSGHVILLDYLLEKFYSFHIRISPIEQIIIVKLFVNDYNNYRPNFLNLPLNLSFSLSKKENFITKLSAYDNDFNNNQNLKYYLFNYNTICSINQTNGIIIFKSKKSFHQINFQFHIGVSDGLYLTQTYLNMNFNNYINNRPKFSSNKYIFYYQPNKHILGQINAYDYDRNDRIFYQLYLHPNEIIIDHYSGLITINHDYFTESLIEFYASAMDLAKQIVYTKIRIIYFIQPKFSSNFYYINLNPSNIRLPMVIFQFNVVNIFNQPLKYVKYYLKNQTKLFEININRLILKEILFNNYLLNINAYWNNFLIQTSIQINLIQQNFIEFNKNYYEFMIEKKNLKENFLIHRFNMNNSKIINLISTPLTRNNCSKNFYLKYNELLFNIYPILSKLCFFELQFINNNKIFTSSQIKILFQDLNLKPKFSSNIYYFYVYNQTDIFRIFATSINSVHYQLENNSYGIIINKTNGRIMFKYDFNLIQYINQIQLTVYAFDDKTMLNDTAFIYIIFNESQQFEIPKNHTNISLCPNVPILLSDQSLPGKLLQRSFVNEIMCQRSHTQWRHEEVKTGGGIFQNGRKF